jgi:RNA polymerase sigma factor (sigma-70 family)
VGLTTFVVRPWHPRQDFRASRSNLSARFCVYRGMEPAIHHFRSFFLALLMLIVCWVEWPFLPSSAILCGHAPDRQTSGLSVVSNLLAPGRIIGDMHSEMNLQQPAVKSDSDLVMAALNGERDAFAGLYQRHAGWMRPLLWRLTGGDQGLADDLLQDSFVQAWQKLEQLREPERFGGWLKQLAINLALSDRRRLKVVGTADGLAELPDIEPPWPATDLDLERAIAKLPTRARDVLVLFCLEGFSHQEIAATLRVEVGTSKAQLHRARELLKDTLS